MEIREEARREWDRIISNDKNNIVVLNKIITNTFGQPIRLSEITENQKDLFEIVLAEMKEL